MIDAISQRHAPITPKTKATFHPSITSSKVSIFTHPYIQTPLKKLMNPKWVGHQKKFIKRSVSHPPSETQQQRPQQFHPMFMYVYIYQMLAEGQVGCDVGCAIKGSSLLIPVLDTFFFFLLIGKDNVYKM